MKKQINFMLTTLLALALVFGSFTQAIQAEDEVKLSTSLNGKGYTEPESLGDAIDTVTALTSAVYDEVDGKLIAYAMSNGGFFNAVDVAKNELIYSEQIANIQQVWAHVVTDDHVVYMAALGAGNNGQLLRYDPKVGKVEDLGVPFPGYQFWSATTDGKDNIYIGTFKEHEASVFKYDIKANKFENLGVVDAVNKLGYVRSIAHHDGALYLGMGAQGLLYKMDLTTKEITNITGNAYDLINKKDNKEDIKYLYDMAVVKNHLVTRFDHDGEGAVLFFNLIDQKWEEKILTRKHDGNPDDYGAFGWNDLVDLDGVTYISYERHIHEIDTNTMSDRRIENAKFMGFRGAAVFDFGQGNEFVSSTRLGDISRVSLDTGKINQLPNVMKGMPLKLHNLGKDTEGNLYVTTYPGGPRGAKYTMETESYNNYAQGQAEGLVAGEKGEMYFGIYPGAVIQKMDTETNKITKLFELKSEHEQDRPYIMKYDDGLLLIGTIPDYKKLGGSLSIYDPISGEVETHRDVVKDQSIVGLAKRGNFIFGSTTTKGGLDITPTATTPVIFVWDIEAKAKVKEIELKLPGLSTTPMISGLTFDDQGRLWGAVDGHIFTMDPETHEITQSKNIYPNVQNRGMWRPVHIEFGDDGFVYTDLGGRMTIIDPSTEDWQHTTVATAKEVDFMTLSHDKDGNQNVYIVQANPTGIDVIKIVDVEPTYEDDTKVIAKVLSDVKNEGFEVVDTESVEEETVDPLVDEVTPDPKKPYIPGWSSLFDDVTDNVSYEVSDELAYSGTHSLKIMDGHDKETVFVISDPIEITPEVTYTAEVMLYLNDGMNTLVLRYYDENGKQVNTDGDSINIIHVR